MEALDRIRGRCVLPDSFSTDDRRAIVRVIHYVLDGLRDIGALCQVDKRLDDEYTRQMNLILSSLEVRSSIIYLTPNQRLLTHEDNSLRQQLLEIQHQAGTEGEKAKTFLKEIGRLEQILRKSISVMQLGIIRGVTIESASDEPSRLQCKILYQVLLPEQLERSSFYREATGLAAKDIRKYLLEKGIGVESVVFLEVSSESWSESDVEEPYRLAIKQTFASRTNAQRAA